ncbi:hypothetical protein Nepgr_015094 [Nepenthes gracilis]|uniref:Uncharacterized protein n=1 Tax=Nepenthes gracilis TaxID=150966 RepID=A0AAD3SL70_NEPGR|nr:hypothetical protein Nepgr_015094 [Nepenthes gracilis]
MYSWLESHHLNRRWRGITSHSKAIFTAILALTARKSSASLNQPFHVILEHRIYIVAPLATKILGL